MVFFSPVRLHQYVLPVSLPRSTRVMTFFLQMWQLYLFIAQAIWGNSKIVLLFFPPCVVIFMMLRGVWYSPQSYVAVGYLQLIPHKLSGFCFCQAALKHTASLRPLQCTVQHVPMLDSLSYAVPSARSGIVPCSTLFFLNHGMHDKGNIVNNEEIMLGSFCVNLDF